MSIVMSGKTVSECIYEELKSEIANLKMNNIQPKLYILTSGADHASQIYVCNKLNRATEIGILAEEIHSENLNREIYYDFINHNPNVPIIVQLPIAGNLTEAEISNSLSPIVDVDGFTQANKASLFDNSNPYFYPCTPAGIMYLLDYYDIPIDGKKVVAIGRSNIVGRPIASMLEHRNATVTICHSHTPKADLLDYCSKADIIISAVGKRNVLSADEFMASPNQVFIDVGINRDENGKICGDFDSRILDECYAYTPVPGGVGVMTVAMLMKNVVRYYKKT